MANRRISELQEQAGLQLAEDDLLKVAPEAKTVPQIFIRGKHIGGYNDLMTYFEETTSNYGH